MSNITRQIEKTVTPDALVLIRDLGQRAAELNYSTYIVGGSVRDILLGRSNVDIDVVVEGDAIVLARNVSKELDCQSKTHPKFGTANLTIGNISLDLTTARSETYLAPGALPKVTPSLLKSDLLRRDFTINAMAASISPKDFGSLIDYSGGLDDLKAGLIRVMHPNSFMDDATRIFRAVRYEQRLDFRIEGDTETWLKRDLSMIDTISGDRLRRELELILNEGTRFRVLERAERLGVMGQLHPSLKGNGWFKAKLQKDYDYATCFSLLTYNLDEEACRHIVKRLNISGKSGQIIKEVQKIKKELDVLSSPVLYSSHVYRMLEKYSTEAINVVIIALEPSEARQRLQLYIEKLQQIQPILNGDDLKKMGITTGRKIGQILKELTNAKLDQRVRNRNEEERLVKSLIRGDKP